jgi:hypothetical protein
MNVEGASMAHQGVNQRRKLEEMNLEQVADEMALGPTSSPRRSSRVRSQAGCMAAGRCEGDSTVGLLHVLACLRHLDHDGAPSAVHLFALVRTSNANAMVKSLAGSSRSSAGVRLKWAPAEADARCISWDGEVTPGLRSGQKR